MPLIYLLSVHKHCRFSLILKFAPEMEEWSDVPHLFEMLFLVKNVAKVFI